jgi:hypothetical protein
MASKKSLNAKNLEALGARHLSELLIDLTKGNAEAKRRLRLELAGTLGSDEVAKEVRKRLASIARSSSFVDWDKVNAMVKDLELQHTAIVTHVAKDSPEQALELLWRFMGLTASVIERCDDSNGGVIDVFHFACEDLGKVALAAGMEPVALADQVFQAFTENDYGQYDYLIEGMTPALGDEGIEHLKSRFVALSNEPVQKRRGKDREVIGYGSSGPIYADDYTAQRREMTVQLALQAIADAQGDVDAYIAQQSDKARTVPAVAADIGSRLLAAGRLEEALVAVDAANLERQGWVPVEWEKVRTGILDALGRTEEAQKFRWTCFEASLDDEHLRAYLKRLPDFEDMEAEERAMAHVLDYQSFHTALGFLINWPALKLASQLVLTRSDELDGNHYGLLNPAATALEGKYPLAATLLRRAMIDFTLAKARSTRYRHAARHLVECQGLVSGIEDFGGHETHDEYVERLQAKHGRKSSFWSLFD